MVRNSAPRPPIRTKRILEILPGFVSWSLILFPVWGSFVIPELVAYYVIAFSVYWLYRSLSVAILALFAIQAPRRFNWLADLEKFKHWRRVHHIIVMPTYKEPLTTLDRTLAKLTQQTYPRQNLHLM